MIDFGRLYEDLVLRYLHTYIRYKPTSNKEFETVSLAAIYPGENAAPTFALQGLAGTQIVRYGGEGEINFEFPATGVFNFNNIGYSFFRRPIRQNKRALCASTSTRGNFYTTNRLILMPSMELWMADSMFRPTYPDFATAIQMLKDGTSYCVGISSEFMVGLSITKAKDFLLFHHQTPIATVSEDTLVRTPLHPVFQRKVYDAPR
jgi:hypothetical protein